MTIANPISLLMLARLFKREGGSCWVQWRFNSETLWKDLALSIGGPAIAGSIVQLLQHLPEPRAHLMRLAPAGWKQHSQHCARHAARFP